VVIFDQELARSGGTEELKRKTRSSFYKIFFFEQNLIDIFGVSDISQRNVLHPSTANWKMCCLTLRLQILQIAVVSPSATSPV